MLMIDQLHISEKLLKTREKETMCVLYSHFLSHC